MSYEQLCHSPLKYDPVAYPGSALQFRGPALDLDEPYVLCLGGSETFGRFIEQPYATELQARLPCPVVNLGVLNAGLDVMTGDPVIRAMAEGASAVVLQVPGAANMTNRFYTVHTRRNDRFLRASTMLKTIYPDVDFTEFHFTRHLLSHLQTVSEERMSILIEELRVAWTARMTRFITRCAAPVHLLWLSTRRPDTEDLEGLAAVWGGDPIFVTEAMLKQVAGQAASLSTVMPMPNQPRHGTDGKVFAPQEEAAARVMPGPDAHHRAADLLLPRLETSLSAAAPCPG